MISSFKQYLVEEEKTVFFTFGRMNPPTIGHEKLMNELAKKSGKNSYKVFLSQSQDKKKDFNSYRFDREEKLSLSDCEEQLKDWARELVDREIRRRPEGLKLKQLEDLKTKAIDQVMESGTPEELIKQLDQTTKKIGIAWIIDTSKIKQIEA